MNMAKELTLTIDGLKVTAPAGTLIVDAAKKVGITIPVFCYHPKMEPVGMCRMCLVEIGRPVIDRATNQPVMNEDGSPKIQFGPKLETACTTPVSEGMVVVGMSEKVKAARKDVLEFLLTSHPLDCPVCDKGGECPLQNLTMRFGPGTSRYIYDEKSHAAKHVPLGDLIYLDRERCIQCARCVRFQTELADDPVIGFYNRGRALEIRTSSEPGFDSIFSGNTTDICPVGALSTADFRFGARPWELKSAASICTHCPVGCNLTYNTRVEAKAGGKVVIKRAVPRQNEQVNELWICDKGRFGYHYAESQERLTQPLIRKNGELVPVGWDEALYEASEKIRSFSFNFTLLAGGRLSNEDLYSLRELAAALNGQTQLYSTMAGGDLTARMGLDSSTNLGKLGAGTTFLVAACDLYEEAPVWWLRIKAAVKRGAGLVVANARSTRLDKIAHHQIRYAYGREAETIRGLLDTPDNDEVHRLLAESESLIVIYGSDGTGLQTSRELSKACAEILIQTQHAGKPNGGLLPAWQHANDQGAWDLGFRPVEQAERVLEHNGVIYIAGADPAGDCPDCRRSLRDSNYVIVQELFLTETARLADIVLPVQSAMERDGTFTSGERRVQRFYPVIQPVPGTLPDYEIVNRINQLMDQQEPQPVSAAQIFSALADNTADYAGLTYRQLSEAEDQWPEVGANNLYFGGTAYKNSQGLGVKLQTAVERGEVAEPPQISDAVSPLAVEGLRAYPISILYDHGQTISKSILLESRFPAPYVIVHPQTAVIHHLAEKTGAKLSLRGEKYPVQVRLDPSCPVEVVLVPRSLGIPVTEPAPVKFIK
jgi:NADH-quinone oxidoreductase subunit G